MNLSSIRRIPVVFSLFFTLIVFCDKSLSLNLEDIVEELQNQVKELKRSRQEDSEIIRKLHEKVHRYVKEDDSLDFSETLHEDHWNNVKSSDYLLNLKTTEIELKRFSSELQNLKSQLQLAVESDDSHMPVVKAQLVYLRQEVLRLRKMVEEQEERKAEENHAASSRVAVRWLQKTVEDLRHEIKEMASSLNTSAALNEKQRTESKLDLLRSDMNALEHRMDSVRVDRERNAAHIQQQSRDIQELRASLQELAAQNTKISIELESLKAEFNEHNMNCQKKNPLLNNPGGDKEQIWTSNKGKSHLRFRHGHWKAQVDNLHDIVDNLEQQQSALMEELKVVRKKQAISFLKLNAVEKTCFNLMNKSEPLELEQRVTNQRVEILEGIVNKTERQTLDIQSRMNNIKKLHGSTMQLFEALERFESNHDRTTADIRREMSKLDYNLSQTQSDLEEIRDRQIATDEIVSTFKTDVESIQSESRKNHLRILLIQSAISNKTLQSSLYTNHLAMQEAKLSALENQIQTLSQDVNSEKIELEALHRQVMEKADEQDLSRWEKIHRKMRDSILEFREDMPRIQKRQQKIEQEFEKLAEQLPADCSLNSSLEHVSENKSGVYLIHPTSHSDAIKVFCDMETSGGQWTVIQRRFKGDHSFEQDWEHYKNGFGDVTSGDFWLGNDFIHEMTTSNDYALRIDMWDSLGKYSYAEYNTFRILHEMDNYRLVLSGYRGNASDAMEYHNGMPFSTPDRDNDASVATHCGQFYGSGWWYNHCQFVNINGRFNTGITWYNIDAQEWSELTRVEMKIKLRKLVFF